MFNRRFRRRVRVELHSDSKSRSQALKIAAIVAACLAVVILLSVLLGNYLRNKAEESPDLPDSETTPAPIDQGSSSLPPLTYNASLVPVTQAEYVTLSSSAGINWGERTASLKEKGIKAVSLVLYYGDGVLNYSSKTAQELGFQSLASGKTVLYEAIGVLGVAEIKTSGCFYVNCTQKETPSLQNIYREYEAALLAEASDAGFTDITLFNIEPTEAGALEAYKLISSAKSLHSGSKYGVALPQSVLKAADRELIFANFARTSSFLALDLSLLTSSDELNAALIDAASLINKYNLRIFVSSELADHATILANAGCTNWQVIPN